jgi:alpha-glucosidase (family GH31 glycosyl hydrolase)
MQVKESHEWFKSQNMRTMIIERSAFAGLGKFGSRWLCDNFSRYAYMGYSVTGIMMHNILGIPLAGADICGFLENTNPELCVRWYTVGAFYPFSRNHNSYGNIPQEPYSFTNDSKVLTSYTDMMRNSMQ